MSKAILGLIVLFGASAVLADDYDDRAKLAGQWTLQSDSSGEQGSTWTIESKGDAVRIMTAKGEQKLADFECNTVGKECEVKDSGKSVKVTFYCNGPKLVEMETRGSEVVKRRFGLAGQGDMMEVEIIPLVPSGKTETLHFKRVSVAVAGK